MDLQYAWEWHKVLVVNSLEEISRQSSSYAHENLLDVLAAYGNHTNPLSAGAHSVYLWLASLENNFYSWRGLISIIIIVSSLNIWKYEQEILTHISKPKNYRAKLDVI